MHLVAGDPWRCRRPDQQLEGDGHEAASNCSHWCSSIRPSWSTPRRICRILATLAASRALPAPSSPPHGAARGTAVSASARQPQPHASRVPHQGPPLHQESPGALVLSLTSVSC